MSAARTARPDSTQPARRYGGATRLGDFTLGPRALLVTAIALPVGGASAVAAFRLLRLIGLITNAVFCQRLSAALAAPGAHHHSAWLILRGRTQDAARRGRRGRDGRHVQRARRGLHLTREYTTDPLETFFAREVMTPLVAAGADVFVVQADSTLREVANAFARHELTRVAVADAGGVVGEITLEHLLHATRRDIHEDEHWERFLYLSVLPPARPTARGRGRLSGG